MKKTKNNKGFSLVELIVVVLILGILAVAVTPQVMKWVGKSKISADKDSANALKSAITTALADWQAQDGGKIGASGDNLTATVGNNNTQMTSITLTGTWVDAATTTKLKNRIDEVTAGDYPVSKYDTDGFQITINGGSGKVDIVYGAESQGLTD